MPIEEVRTGAIEALLTTTAAESSAKATTGLVFAHGAGGNYRQPFLEKLAAALAEAGVDVLRINLPFRQKHAGPPRPNDAPADRAGILEALQWMRARGYKRVIAGGQSYGGRQASMLAAEQPQAADALLFTSYPLHPPGKPDALRFDHWPAITAPAFFVHGTRDPFGTIDEMQRAVALLGGPHHLFIAEGQGHGQTKITFVEAFLQFLANSSPKRKASP